MAVVSFVVIIGNPRPGSRTARAASAVAAAVAAAADVPGTPEIIDLADLAPHLLAADPPAAVAEATAKVAAADVILVASPTYKGTYTGLLKVFLDRFGAGSLTGKAALPLLVLGAPQHALAVEVHLRPLLVELGATVPTPGLALLEADLDRLDSLAKEWAAQIPPAVRGALTAGAAR
ncbi:NAD(P)H-dependent oxidoreductase [Actinomadura parmotrematis]|uniref:NAD(P)H-dependent oxidoreductase n=1 Tax=Actinomadura parmotrematis TaxID=2864039 RepID=A0ABS7FUS6_9ACTN|nr:NAD(P)H-dependent oxidoreductase [Actinomadura parmotrematis]MBW8484168.1 NAD(P)H-dependent oxidoreductase [Actinomadura parmotrematis]